MDPNALRYSERVAGLRACSLPGTRLSRATCCS